MKLKSVKDRVSTTFVVFILLFGSVTAQAVGPLFTDGFEDPPSVVVNSTADDGDISAGDAKCDTGNTIAGGDAECTLRAAIQEVNSGSEIKWILFAIPGLPPHVIQPAIPLPDITRSTASIRGPAMVAGVAQVVVDGSAGGGISGLVIENNGNDIGCEGGGIYSASEWLATQPVQVINTTIINNNGAGILSGGPVWLSSTIIEDNIGPGVVAAETLLGNVTIQRNEGQGVFIYQPLGGASDQSVVTASAGINEISGNLGHGIVAERGNVVANRGVELNIRDNAGWGIVMYTGVAELGVSDDEALVTRAINGNGFEEECSEWVYDVVSHSIMPYPFHLDSCHGGGVYSAGVRTATSFFDATSISGNNGPGILTKARVNLSRSTISENESSGIRVVDADSVASDTDLKAELQFQMREFHS